MLPVFDGHNDALTRADHAAFAEGRPAGHLDLPKMRAGGIRGAIFAIFTPSPGNYNWVPSAYVKSLALTRGHTYLMIGTKLNGLSQATAYGDDLQCATNYPIVRLTNVATGHVFYCRTHGHSSMAVGYTGPVKTQLDIPANMETGPSFFEVIANGIPSQPFMIQVQ